MRLTDYRILKRKKNAEPGSDRILLSQPKIGSLKTFWPAVRRCGKNDKIFFIADRTALAKLGSFLPGQPMGPCGWVAECSEERVKQLTHQAEKEKAGLLVGVGGGKSLDTTKLVGEKTGLPLILIPSSSATCAAFSPVAVVYHETHEFREVVDLAKPGSVVLVDLDLIFDCPPRYLAAGMADSLAKWVEARAVLYSAEAGRQDGRNETGNVQAALETARDVFEKVMEKGAKAFKDQSKQRRSTEWEEAAQANLLLSGMVSFMGGRGFPAGLAHSFANGLTVLPQAGHILHGEAVGLGLLLEETLLAERCPALPNLREDLKGFFKQTGLPCTLQEAGLRGFSPEWTAGVADKMLAAGESLYSLGFKISKEELLGLLENTV